MGSLKTVMQAGLVSLQSVFAWNHEYLDPETASTQLEEHYCEETGCMISCIGKTCIRIYKAIGMDV